MEKHDRSGDTRRVETSSPLDEKPTPTTIVVDASRYAIDTHEKPAQGTFKSQITANAEARSPKHAQSLPQYAYASMNSAPQRTTGTESTTTYDIKPSEKCGGMFTEHHERPEPTPMPWHPTLFRRAPLAGLGGLLIAMFLLFASYAVLAAANGDEVASWKYEPNVYLAVFTAIAHRAIGFALIQGTIVTFWNRVLRGTTLGQLHRDWSYGLYVYRAIFAGRDFNMLALACICATLVAVDGPLMQRSVTVHASTPSTQIPLQVHVVPEIPSYKTGWTFHNGSGWVANVPDYMTDLIKDYASGQPFHAIKGCPETCSAQVRGPALAVDTCSSTTRYVNFSNPFTPEQNTNYNGGQGLPPISRKVFDVTLRVETGEVEKLLFETTIAESPGNSTCAAMVNTTRCYLVSAIADYPVNIDGNAVKLAGPQSYPDIVQYANNTALTNRTITEHGLMSSAGLLKSTLGGIVYAATLSFHTSEYLLPYSNIMVEDNPASAPWTVFTFQHTVREGSPDHCVPKFSDPRDQVMASLNEVMFRVGAYWAAASNQSELEPLLDGGVDIHSNVTGTLTSPVNVFRVDFSYFAGAAVIELFAIFVILFTFHGWWNLGRDFSFSPLEIGKAFDAPLLRDLACELPGREIAMQEGQRMVKYGVVQGETVNVTDHGYISGKISIADLGRVSALSGRRLSDATA